VPFAIVEENYKLESNLKKKVQQQVIGDIGTYFEAE